MSIAKDAPDIIEKVEKSGSKITKWWHKIPDKKQYVEFVTAVLTVPVLITAIVLNWGNITGQDTEKSPTVIEKITQVTPRDNDSPQACKKQVGPVTIAYPKEGEKVNDNPLCLIIKYSDERYCPVEYSYRINNGKWSQYSSSAPCIYDMSSGEKKFEVRIRSTQSQDQEMLERNFMYDSGMPEASPTPASSSAALQ